MIYDLFMEHGQFLSIYRKRKSETTTRLAIPESGAVACRDEALQIFVVLQMSPSVRGQRIMETN